MKTTRKDLLARLPILRIPAQYNESHPVTPGEAAPKPDPLPEPAPESTPEPVEHQVEEPSTLPARPRPVPRPRRSALPRYLTRILRGVAGLDLTAGSWLLLVATDKVPCSTRLCEVATLDGRDHTAGLVALAVAGLLIFAAPFTSGLSRADAVTTALLVLVAVAGVIAVIGVVLMATLVLSLIGLMIAALLGVLIGAVRGDLTR